MSTYTDLHNRIKENLTILRKPGSKDDGMSPQKVILINPENQFYGTFNGKMTITSGILSGLKIIDSELEGVKLDDASVDGMSLRELKTTVDVNTQDIEQLQKDAKTISAAHDALSVGLSSAVDNLSVTVNEKLDNAVEEVKKSISGVVGDVTILSIGLGDLSSKVETLSSGMLNGVVYRGQLVLHRDYYTLPRQLFNDDPACCLLEGTQAPLKNGWMWRVYLDRENVSGDYVHVSDPNTGRELDLGKGDYIIIKNHLTSLYEVVPDDQMRMDDFDVINAQDEDDTKLAVLKQVSAYLDNKIDESLISAKDYTDEVSSGLSALFDGKLSSVSAYALAESIKYTNGVSSEICSTVNTKLITLSNDLSSYSNKLCSDLSTQVDAEFVHRAGDTIAKLSVEGELSVAGKTTISNALELNDDFNASTGTYAKISRDGVVIKTHAGTTLKSDDQIEIKTNAPIVETASRFRGTFTNGLEISSDAGLASLSMNGKTIQSTLDDLSNYLNEKKLDVELAKQLSSQLMISTDLPSNVAFDYLSAENILRLSIQGTFYDIDVTEFLDDKIVENVYTTIEDGKIWLHITFRTSTSGDLKTIDICVNDLIHPYWAGHGISVDNNLCIHIADYFYDQVQNIQSYVDELSGPPGPRVGIISSLSAAIEAIDLAQTQELYFAGMIELDTADTSKHYPTVGHFLSVEVGGLDVPSQVRNNSYFTVKFIHGLSSSETIVTEDGLSVGDGDQIIIHDHNPSEGEEVKFISWGDLKLIDDDAAGNVYLIKAGVSRYEFEAEAKKRADDDNYISAWIEQNFANTGSESSVLTTTLKQDVSASNNLSVVNDAIVRRNFNALSNTFRVEVNDSIPTKPKNQIVGSAEYIDFNINADDGAQLLLNGNSINLSAQHIWFNDVLSVESETSSTIATILSVGILSSDALTARVVDVYEKLNATSSYNDYLSASQIDAREANVEKLSVDAFHAREAEISENLSVENAVVRNELKVGNEFNALSGAFMCYKDDNGDIYVNTNADAVFIGVANENAHKEDPQLDPASTTIKIEPSYIDISSDGVYLATRNLDLSADEVIADFENVKDRQSMSSITDLCSALSTSISSLEDYVASCDAIMSAAIDNKIFIDGLSTETLSAVHIGQEDYYNLVSSSSVLSNVLYVVSSDYINAYGQRIENLAEPKLSTDAATKGYVDGISSSLNSQIQQLSDALSDEIETLSTNLSTSISTLTSQMELALSALDQDPLSSLNVNSKISVVIDAVLDIRDTLSALRSILRIS